LPAVPAAVADQPALLPGPAVDAHLDPSDPSRARPGHPANGQVARLEAVGRPRLGDQGTDPLQRRRLAHHLPVAFVLEEVRVALIVAREALADHLDAGEPFYRADRIPAGNDDPQRIAVLDGQWLTVHRVGEQH